MVSAVVPVGLLLGLGLCARHTVLPEGSAISSRALEAAWANLEGLPAPGGFEDPSPAGPGRRRLLSMPDEYYEECVYRVNAVRSREGLPVLQRWRDFEPCSDRGVKYDAKQNEYHSSASKGLYCDWATYKSVAQNSCPKWFTGLDAIGHCTEIMWNEKNMLVRANGDSGKLVCEDGQDATSCAGHYLNLRGGEFGYNAYDRVACGFYIHTDEMGVEELWINQNFGFYDGREPSSANSWLAPDGWVPADVQAYGYMCGGDAATKPGSLLVPDCEISLDDFQYNECAGAARRDYKWLACVVPTCDLGYTGPCKDLSVGTYFEIYQNDEPEGHDICPELNADPEMGPLEDPCTSSRQYYFVYPEGTRRSFRTAEVCRATCGRCACPTGEFDVGFTPFPTPSPSTPLPTPAPEPTPAPTEAFDCPTIGNKRTCKKQVGCRWGDDCLHFDGDCSPLSRTDCRNAYKCVWASGVCLGA